MKTLRAMAPLSLLVIVSTVAACAVPSTNSSAEDVGSIEQAWLMCLVVNAERTSRGPQNIEGQTIYLRRVAGGAVMVVSTENWQDSSPQCDR